MKSMPLFGLLVCGTCLMAQSPVKKTVAYSRATIPGIPANDTGAQAWHNPFPPSYLIYVVAQKGAIVSATSVCVKGQRHDAVLRQVRSPVTTPHDVNVPTGKVDTLVQSTTDDVYQVELGEPKGSCANGGTEDKLSRQYEVVVRLRSSDSDWYALAPKLTPLPPAAAK